MNELIKFKFYENAIEANRDKQVLAENDIQSFIANEQTIQSDWLLSQALGGIQLEVFSDDFDKAKEILDNYEKSEKQELEVDFMIDNPSFDFLCPKCGSNHIYRDDSATSFFGISILKTHNYVCYYCDNKFSHE